jgi:hypothetical protein
MPLTPDAMYPAIGSGVADAADGLVAPNATSDANETDDTWVGAQGWRPSGFLEWFAVGQTVLPALLFVPGMQALRPAIRAGAFLISLAAFVYCWLNRSGRARAKHPAQVWLRLIFVCLVAMMFHPDTDSLLAGFGQTALYAAVFSPLFWVPALVTTRHQLMRILAILLICNGINSCVGVLQVYDPDRWMPAEFSSAFMMNHDMLEGSTYEGPDGRRIVRPPGLFDTPGAVCGAGTVAALLGLVFFLERMRWWKRAAALVLGAAGLAAVYLSHVRASAVVAAGMMLTYLVMLALQGQKKRATQFLGLAAGLVVVTFMASTILGGAKVRERFMSLIEGDPRTLYYHSRGVQLDQAFGDILTQYPMGAGLARWGVITGYVGTARSRVIWAEIQPTAWILDGGIFLLVLYPIALIATVIWEFKLVRILADPNDRLWSSVIVAANVGTLALVVSFVPFTTQLGLQFWFLEGLLHGVMATRLVHTS